MGKNKNKNKNKEKVEKKENLLEENKKTTKNIDVLFQLEERKGIERFLKISLLDGDKLNLKNIFINSGKTEKEIIEKVKCKKYKRVNYIENDFESINIDMLEMVRKNWEIYLDKSTWELMFEDKNFNYIIDIEENETFLENIIDIIHKRNLKMIQAKKYFNNNL